MRKPSSLAAKSRLSRDLVKAKANHMIRSCRLPAVNRAAEECLPNGGYSTSTSEEPNLVVMGAARSDEQW
jgi:hypothetical protein